MAFVEFVTFLVSGEEYGIEINSINVILRSKNYKIFKIPNSPKHLEGIINLRGKLNPIFNLKKKFNFDDTSINDDSKIIIVNNGKASTVGFIVDEVTDIFKLDESEVDSAPDGFNDYIKGMGKVEDKIILILDLVKVLSNDEITQAQSINSMAPTE